MSNKVSVILGIISSLLWIMMLFVMIRLVNWFIHPTYPETDSLLGIYLILLIYLALILVFIGLAGGLILFGLGVPHYFKYVYDQHRPSYIYLIKYLSAIPVILVGFWGLIVLYIGLRYDSFGLFNLYNQIAIFMIGLLSLSLLLFTKPRSVAPKS